MQTTDELMATRQFKSEAEILAAFLPGTSFWSTHTNCGEPNGVAGPFVVTGVTETYQEDHKVTWINTIDSIFVSFPNYKDRHSVSDLQNSEAKAVFTTEEAAQAYFKLAKEIYETDHIWRDRCEEFKFIMDIADRDWDSDNYHYPDDDCD